MATAKTVRTTYFMLCLERCTLSASHPAPDLLPGIFYLLLLGVSLAVSRLKTLGGIAGTEVKEEAFHVCLAAQASG